MRDGSGSVDSVGPSVNVSASPALLDRGDTTRLSWTTSGARWCWWWPAAGLPGLTDRGEFCQRRFRPVEDGDVRACALPAPRHIAAHFTGADYANLVASYLSRRFAARTLKVYREIKEMPRVAGTSVSGRTSRRGPVTGVKGTETCSFG